MKILPSLCCFFAMIALVSCDKNRVFDEYKSVGSSWNKDSIVSFELPQLEAAKKYNLFVNVRDNNDFPFNNLFLIVSLEQPNKQTLVDTLEYQMANPDGTLLGEGFTDIKENKLIFKQNATFNQKGVYKINIQQAVRETGKIVGEKELKGVTEVGFRIESIE